MTFDQAIRQLLIGPEDMQGTHQHKCVNCCHVWEHEDAMLAAPKHVFDEAHRCPNCHMQLSDNRYKYDPERERNARGWTPWKMCEQKLARMGW